MSWRIDRARFDRVIGGWMIPMLYVESGWSFSRSWRLWPTRFYLTRTRS